jgi:hypothetical protein
MSGGVGGSGSRASGGHAPWTPGGDNGSDSRASAVLPPHHYSTSVSGSGDSGVSPMQWTCSVCRSTYGGWRQLQQHQRRSLCRSQMPAAATGDNPVHCECSCGQRFDSIASGSKHVSLHAHAGRHLHSIRETPYQPINLVDALSQAQSGPSAPASPGDSLHSLSSLDGGLAPVQEQWTPDVSASPLPSTSPQTADSPDSLDGGLMFSWGSWTPESSPSPDPISYPPAGQAHTSPQVQLCTCACIDDSGLQFIPNMPL